MSITTPVSRPSSSSANCFRPIRSDQFDPNRIALLISQTAGGCRATNYIAFLKKALVDSGIDHIPIISFNMSGYARIRASPYRDGCCAERSWPAITATR